MTQLFEVTIQTTYRRVPEMEELGVLMPFGCDLLVRTEVYVFTNAGTARQCAAHAEASAKTARQTPGVEVEVTLE